MTVYYGVYRVFGNGNRKYVSRTATPNAKLAIDIARDYTNGIEIMPDGRARNIPARPHIAMPIDDNRYRDLYTAWALVAPAQSLFRKSQRKTRELGAVCAETRDEAISLAFKLFPEANEARSGTAYRGGSDIQWTKRSNT